MTFREAKQGLWWHARTLGDAMQFIVCHPYSTTFKMKNKKLQRSSCFCGNEKGNPHIVSRSRLDAKVRKYPKITEISFLPGKLTADDMVASDAMDHLKRLITLYNKVMIRQIQLIRMILKIEKLVKKIMFILQNFS